MFTKIVTSKGIAAIVNSGNQAGEIETAYHSRMTAAKAGDLFFGAILITLGMVGYYKGFESLTISAIEGGIGSVYLIASLIIMCKYQKQLTDKVDAELYYSSEGPDICKYGQLQKSDSVDSTESKDD